MKKVIFIILFLLLFAMSACTSQELDNDFILGEEIGVYGDIEFVTQKKGMLGFNVSFTDEEEILNDVRIIVLLEDGTVIYVFDEANDGIEQSGIVKHIELYYLSQNTTYYFDFSGYYTNDEGEEISVFLDGVYLKLNEWTGNEPSGEIVNLEMQNTTVYFDLNITNEDYLISKLEYELYDSNLALVKVLTFDIEVINGLNYKDAYITDLELETTYTLKIKVYYYIEGVEYQKIIDAIVFPT